MTDIERQLASLTRAVTQLAEQISPWIGQVEMQARYGVTGKTLLAMERRREIPTRVNGRWKRVDVIQWESREAA